MNNSPLEFKVHRTLIDFAKNVLVLLEDVSNDSESAKFSLEETIDRFPINDSEKSLLQAIVNQGFSFGPNKKAGLRKRILDYGNDATRSLEEEFKKYNINIKHERY